jgi:hypothetical protein
MAGQPGPLVAHRAFERAHQRRNAGRAHRQALLCRSVDLALDRADRVDLAHCFKRERCAVFLAWGRLGEIGQDKEFPPPVAPAGRLGDRPRTSLGVVEPIEPAVGVGLKNPGIAGEMALRVLAVAVAGVEKYCGRRCRSVKRPVVANKSDPLASSKDDGDAFGCR